MRIAAANYPIERFASFDAFAAKQSAWIAAAATEGASLAILPEYLALELASTLDDAVRADTRATLAALAPLHDAYLALFRGLARQHAMHVAAGTFLVANGQGGYLNRAHWFTPGGAVAVQDKLALTGFEREVGVIVPGESLHVFELSPQQRVALSICYDCEFPLPVRAQVEAGARLLVVPSCTDTAAGANRVRVGCEARALENQCYVARAVTTGDAPFNPWLDTNTGEAAIHGPIDRGFPSDGVIARGGDAWVFADLDFDQLEVARREGQVANVRDWPAQSRPALLHARVESLR
ncbi:MAG TPA: carbon-nitrogen hydrolase family protein [Xanthomonadales bacterium]|nr:carbon-nitrogen hydrolase family protein [Xanthomonadales bacterium]